MKFTKNIQNNKLIIFLFISLYLYCNYLFIFYFPANAKAFIIFKIIPVTFIFFIILIFKKIAFNSYIKMCYLFYILFVIAALISSVFSNDPYISYRVMFINICLTVPLLFFYNFVNSKDNFEFMIRLMSILFLLFTSYTIVSELFSVPNDIPLETIKQLTATGFSKGSFKHLGFLGITLFLLEKNFIKYFLLINSFFVLYLTLSTQLVILYSVLMFLILMDSRKYLFILFIFLTSLIILSFDTFFIDLLKSIKDFNILFYVLVVERFLGLFGYQDISNYANNDVAANIAIKLNSLKLFIDNPAFGIGLENERIYSGIDTMAHSGIISILIGTGLLGFIFFYGFFFYIFFNSIKYRYKEITNICILYFTHALMSPVYTVGISTLVIFIVSSLFILKRNSE